MRTRINVSLIPGDVDDDRPPESGISRPAAIEAAHILGSAYDYLDRYLEGWAEVNLVKIFMATAQDYCLDDPFVGQFSRWSIPAYFQHLRARFARAGEIAGQDLAFSIYGPMHGSPRSTRLKFFREAPRLGLTGVTFITIGERGITGETVVYDLNLALDVLRDPSRDPV
jgi:hypothetical protein